MPFLLIFFLFFVLNLSTTSAVAAPVMNDEALTQLAQQKQWQHLLHYRYHPYTFRFASQNDSPSFFLAADGKTSLKAEMTADIKAFLLTEQADNASAQCRFPARYFWLKQQLPNYPFIDQPCSEFDAWNKELNARFLTVIFPAAHINSPSSMYGHTLVRLDRANEKSSKLLAYSVNFAANANPDDNELVFSYKGLTGGYPGVVSVLPYFVKTNEYQHMEYRDIWEYRLNLTQAETDQFIRHIWENKDTYFDYFFFDENCSYRLLALLDASSERIDMTDQFLLEAKPVDTIRVLQQANLVEEVNYRASAASDMEFKGQQASKTVLAIAKQLVDEDNDIQPMLAELSEQEQAQALELAYAYARYLAVKKRQANPVLRARTVALLSARAKIKQPAAFKEAPTPKYRDDEGHKTQRLTFNVGQSKMTNADAQGFVDLGWRIAYHDIMDLPQGFAKGAQIQMGQFNLRVWDGGAVRLQQAKIVDVLSLSENTYFQRPIAWAVSGGFERFIGEEDELFGYLKLAFGKAYVNRLGRFYGLAEAQLLADNQFNHNAQLSIGPRLGWLWQGDYVQAQLEGNYQGLTTLDQTKRTSVKTQFGLRLTPDLQLRLNAEQQWFRRHAKEARAYEVSAGVNWYF